MKRGKRVAAACLVTAGLTSGASHGAGFALLEQSAGQVGNAFAGAAAAAEDASSIFSNPAGLIRQQSRPTAMLALTGVALSVEFSNQGSTSAVGSPASGGNGGEAGNTSALPSLFLSYPLGAETVVGLGIYSPFGLKTEYENGWVGRYQALKSELKTVNISPAIAHRFNRVVSAGLALTAQYADVELSTALDFGAICFGGPTAVGLGPANCSVAGVFPQGKDGTVRVNGKDWSYGFNFGLLFELSDSLRAGFAYRSKISHKLSGGEAVFDKPTGLPLALALAPTFSNTNAEASATLPEIVSLSVYGDIAPRWSLLGDITWTHWSRFKELRIHFANGSPDSVTPQNWQNSYRLSLGAIYRMDEQWRLRTGVAYDQTPVRDEFRQPRIPDNDRTWLAFGATYKTSPSSQWDAAYAHLFVKDARLTSTAVGAGTLNGTYKSKVDLLSVQYTHFF